MATFPIHASLDRHREGCNTSVRYGAYLRSIPPENRFGDYVHCTGRVVNIFFKRLLAAPHPTGPDVGSKAPSYPVRRPSMGGWAVWVSSFFDPPLPQ